MEIEPKKVEISTNIVIKTIVILLGLWFLFLVRDIVILLFIAVIIAASIDPAVDYLQKKKVPRAVGAMLLYAVLFSAIALIISFMVPSIVNQFNDFSKNSSQYFGDFGNAINSPGNSGINRIVQSVANNVESSFSNISKNIFSKTLGVFSGLLSVVVVFSMAFYMVMEESGIKKFIVSIMPEKKKEYAASLTDRIEGKIGKWMIGQLFLMLVIFILDFVGLYLVGVPYPLLLAIFAGILEVVPYVGPIISAVPGIILGFLVSPTVGMMAFVVYLVAQQIESHVVIPLTMKKAVGLNPVVTIVAILIGFKLAGVLGAIIAVPAATAISLFVSDLMEK
ncbi:MAG TPA: AI-2E family transporter [Candidatus Moranbacteria bacterium]|nr:AI-2E family transporter [Candidatus Moranbacteria bacterium]